MSVYGRSPIRTTAFNATFHIAPKAVFNLLGVNFTDRYEHCKH